MGHVIEPAASGRAKCRACGRGIPRGELRFGERLPNAFGEGEMTLWFHLPCAAHVRPDSFLDVADLPEEAAEIVPGLREVAAATREHRRLPRARQAGRAPTARARCRSCRERIEKGAWRVALQFYEEGMFHPSGFVHVRCARDYLGTADLLERLRHFSPDLGEDDFRDIGAELHRGSAGEG